jgi:hypothetical protein
MEEAVASFQSIFGSTAIEFLRELEIPTVG